jgi:hypothetical protein
MDIIATGISTSQGNRVKDIIKIITDIQRQYKNEVGKSGLQYSNLFEFVQKKMNDLSRGGGALGDKKATVPMVETELRDALRQLEDDNVLSLFGNIKNPTIRFIQGE